MFSTLKKDLYSKLIVTLFLILTISWAVLYISGLKEHTYNYLFGALYGIVALVGGVRALIISRKWGWTRSVMGKALICLGVGLLSQEFGQIIFSLYNIVLRVEVPYPSIADLGFFGTIPFYIAGILFLAKASGSQFTLNKLSHRIQMILIPVAILIAAYVFFLKDYTFDWTHPIKVLLDFGYPLGQAVYVSIAFVTYSLSKNVLGGVMRNKILLLIIAFISQFIADYNFLYQSNSGSWYNGGYGDYLYLVAYFIMSVGIFELNTVVSNLKHSTK
jgi:hypothetical protein